MFLKITYLDGSAALAVVVPYNNKRPHRRDQSVLPIHKGTLLTD